MMILRTLGGVPCSNACDCERNRGIAARVDSSNWSNVQFVQLALTPMRVLRDWGTRECCNNRESQMSPTHEPVHQLEPSNLLEPLDLEDHHIGPAVSSGSSDRGNPPTEFTRAIASEPIPLSSRRGRRWPLNAALIVAGALTCFGAGAALTQFSTLTTPAAIKPSQTIATRPAAPVAQMELKPEQSKPTQPASNAAAGTGLSESAAPAATAGVPAGSVSQTGTPRLWSDPAPSTPAAAAPVTAKPSSLAQSNPQAASPSRRADARAYGRPQELARSSPDSRRAASRDTADQQLAAEDSVPIVGLWKDRQDRDANRTSSRRRDRTDEYTRNDERRVVERAREDGRVTGTASRDEDRIVGRSPREDDTRVSARAARAKERMIDRVPRDEGPVTTFPRGGDGWFGISPRGWQASSPWR
jgi:hypothetical protein